MEKVRVIQWVTGHVGKAQLRAVIDDSGHELVGVLVFSPEKVGVDAGTLAGRPATGILATGDKAAILAMEADVVLHAASKGYANHTNLDDIVALLLSGKTVITTTSYNHLMTYGYEAYARIHDACRRAGVRFHAAGEHPGFMFERMAVSLTSLSQRVDKITVQEIVNVSSMTERSMLVDFMGMGKRPEELTDDSPMFRANGLQFEQALNAAADVLHMKIEKIVPGIKATTLGHDVTVGCGILEAGTVVAQILSWTAYANGKPALAVEEYWTAIDEVPGWDIKVDKSHLLIRTIVEGVPGFQLDLKIQNGGDALYANTSGGHIAVGMSAIRAIPDVLASPPGVVIPPVFAAYRWPAA